MTKDFLEKTYRAIKEAEDAFDVASTFSEMNAARKRLLEAGAAIMDLSGAELDLWTCYRDMRDSKNTIPNIDDNIRNIKRLVCCMRECGFEEVTFSSTWSGAINTAFEFQKEGCSLEGIIEINGTYRKIPAYLFKLN